MEVEKYHEDTRKSVEVFLKKNKSAITNEIVRLGTDKRVINWQTLTLILDDLEREGLIRIVSVGNKVKNHEWIGEV